MRVLASPQEIAQALRDLQQTSPKDRSDLSAWNAAARDFWTSVSIPLPSGVMHYLHDADIRIKDPAYGAEQDTLIAEIISDLEAGIVPESSGVTFSFHPRWLGAVALLIAALAWLVVRR